MKTLKPASLIMARVSLEKARNKVKDIAQINGMDSTSAAVVNGILGSSSISYITSLFDKNASLSSVNAPAYALKGDNSTALFELREKVQAVLDETTELAQNVSSKAVSEQFKLEMERLRKESFAKIETKNRETEDAMDERAFSEGYTKGSNNYSKKIVTDVSVFSVKTKNVSVRLWQDFETDEPELDFDTLDYGRFDSSEFSVILSLISAQLGDWEENIFGSYEVRGVRGVTGELEKYSYGEHYRGELELGQGLIGQILLDFQKNAAKEQSGWDALEAPGWERKLWCSDTFPGPSVREFSTMVASIVATVCTFGAGAAVAIAVNAGVMAANELTFEMADVGAGWHDWDEAARNVAKAAVSGAITGAASSLSGVASQVGGLGGVFLKTGITSSSSITTQFTNAFIDDGFSGVKDAFNSWSDWQGVAFSTAGSLVTNSLGAANGFDSAGNALNSNTFNTGAVTAFNSLAGGLTTNALEFAFTGETTFNLVNLSMLGLEYSSMWGAGGSSTLSGGLLAMTLGKNGTHFAVSSSGTDISLGNLKLAAAGAKESSKVIDWKYGSIEKQSTLNSINMLGYTNAGRNAELAKDIWDEKLSVNYTDTPGDYGNYAGGSVINISRLLLGTDNEESAKLASVLAHEGTHAYGNRIEGIAHSAALDTYTQINKMYGLTGDIDFATEMVEGMKNPDSWKENTGDVDHWTLAKKDDGTFGWKEDGRLDFYVGDIEISKEYMAYISQSEKWYMNSSVGARADQAAVNYLIAVLEAGGMKSEDVNKFIHNTSGFAGASVIAATMLNGNLSQKNIDSLNSSLYAAQESGVLVKNEIGTLYDTSLPFVLNNKNDLTWITTQYGFDLLNGNIREHNALDIVVNTPKDEKYDAGKTKLVVPETSDVTLSYGKDIGLKETFSVANGSEILYGHIDSNSVLSYIAMFGTQGVTLSSNGKLQNVPAGMISGTIGNTGGKTTGAHLHLGYTSLTYDETSGTYYQNNNNPYNYFTALQNINVTPYAKVTSGLQGINSRDDKLNLSHVMNYYQFVNTPNQNFNHTYNFTDFYNLYGSKMDLSAHTAATIMYLYKQGKLLR